MLSHEQIWRGIDKLAEAARLTPSGLAKRAGLDATTFNRSKRFSPDGLKPRWPSTESLSKALAAAGMEFEAFAALATGKANGRGPLLPGIALTEARRDQAFDAAGLPAGDAWERVRLTEFDDENAYVIEIRGDAMSPVYREGDRVVVSPAERPGFGDRVVVRTRSGELLARQLGRTTATTMEFVAVNRAHPDRILELNQIAWVARIAWVSQ